MGVDVEALSGAGSLRKYDQKHLSTDIENQNKRNPEEQPTTSAKGSSSITPFS
jgi:hypothetical protein